MRDRSKLLGALGMIVAALTVHGAVGSHHDATVFALGLPGTLQPVAAVLMVVFSVTATTGSALMLAGLFLGACQARTKTKPEQRRRNRYPENVVHC
jgi:hypothetical protein